MAGRDRARELIAESGLVVNDDPSLGMLLAIEAMRVTESGGEAMPEAVDAVHWALQEATVQYPADDADIPVAVRPHSTGPRGVFVLSPAELADHGRAALGRPFTYAECERFFAGLSCPGTNAPLPIDLTIAGGMEGYTLAGEGLPLEGTTVELTSGFGPDMMALAEQDLAALGADLGVEVVFRQDIGAAPGDIVSPDLPGRLFEMASERPVVDVGSYIGDDYLRESYGEHLMSLVSRDGSSYGIPMQLDPKSLIFYNPEAFAEAGYTEPATWDELIALSDRMVADGRTPWCLGIFSFDATGFVATDWLETIVLQSEGPDFYDLWAAHKVPFDHPGVVAALEKVGQLVRTPGYHPPGSVGETSWLSAMQMVSEEPPRCLMAPVSDFGPENFGDAPRTVMLFPSVRPEYATAMEGVIGSVFAVADRPEVRAVMRGFASPSWGASMTDEPAGWFSPSHRDFDVGLFTDPIRRFKASAAIAANEAGLFRFDASDGMPGPIGFDVLFKALTEYVSDPELSARDALAKVEEAWLELEEAEAGGTD